MYYRISSQSGLTLIETLMAVFIFSLSLVALMTISSRGVQSLNVASQRVEAQFLAQEGIELIEAARDDNFLDLGAQWLEGIDPCMNPGGCSMSTRDITNGFSPASCNGLCGPLRYDPNTGEYQYDVGDDSAYSRTIFVSGTTSSERVRVSSRVKWSYSGTTYEVQVAKHMTNWFQTQAPTSS